MPPVLKLIAATAWVSAIYRGVLALLSFYAAERTGVWPLLTVGLVSVVAAAYATGVILCLRGKPRRAYPVIALYPLFGAALYVIENALVAAGLYPPRVQ